MPSIFPQRVAFEDDRFLQAADLQDEQLYHLQRRWQHNLALHSWGILCGLEVRIQGSDLRHPSITVHPGMALDGYGRELITTAPVDVLSLQETLDPAVTYDIWLLYNATPRDDGGLPPDPCALADLGDDCDAPETDLGRIFERPEVRLTPTSARLSPTVAEPPGVPSADLRFSPELPMKFDAADRWPVFLGKLECNGTVWRVDDSERRYGGLIAERIEFPFQATKPVTEPPAQAGSTSTQKAGMVRRTAIYNGGHPARPELRFAVVDLVDVVPTTNDEGEQNEGQNKDKGNDKDNKNDEKQQTKKQPRFGTSPLDEFPVPLSIRTFPGAEIAKKAAEPNKKEQGPPVTEIRWRAERVVAEADFILRNGAGVQFDANLPGQETLPPTSGWGIYRDASEAGPPLAASTTKDDGTKPVSKKDEYSDVLQIAMPRSTDCSNSVAIGAVNAEGKFESILEVNDDDTVDVFGTLRVHGLIIGTRSDLPQVNEEKDIEAAVNAIANLTKGAELLTKELTELEAGKKRQIFDLLIVEAVKHSSDGAIVVAVTAIAAKDGGKNILQGLTKLQDGEKKVVYGLLIAEAAKHSDVDKIVPAIQGIEEAQRKKVFEGLIADALKLLDAPTIVAELKVVGDAKLEKILEPLVTVAAGKLGPLVFVTAIRASGAFAKAILKQVVIESPTSDLVEAINAIPETPRKDILKLLVNPAVDLLTPEEFVKSLEYDKPNPKLTALYARLVREAAVLQLTDEDFVEQLKNPTELENITKLQKRIFGESLFKVPIVVEGLSDNANLKAIVQSLFELKDAIEPTAGFVEAKPEGRAKFWAKLWEKDDPGKGLRTELATTMTADKERIKEFLKPLGKDKLNELKVLIDEVLPTL
jgi:hypothetical protein